LIGEFFEVRAQVDRDLATVNRVDRRLGLIKNLGRHKIIIPFLKLGRKTSTNGYPTYIHLAILLQIQLKITDHRRNQKDHFVI
jgi:hypothetical protein